MKVEEQEKKTEKLGGHGVFTTTTLFDWIGYMKRRL